MDEGIPWGRVRRGPIEEGDHRPIGDKVDETRDDGKRIDCRKRMVVTIDYIRTDENSKPEKG